jgi:hypothetical protein
VVICFVNLANEFSSISFQNKSVSKTMKTANPTPMQEIANLRTAKQIAKGCNKPVSTIQRMTRQGLIPCISLGWRTKLYDPKSVRDALMNLMK